MSAPSREPVRPRHEPREAESSRAAQAFSSPATRPNRWFFAFAGWLPSAPSTPSTMDDEFVLA